MQVERKDDDPGEQIQRELGRSPSDQILARMRSLGDQLRVMGPVNKRAAEQHAIFTRQSQQLLARQHELDASAQVAKTKSCLQTFFPCFFLHFTRF